MASAASQDQTSRSTSADEDLAFAGVARLGELLGAGQVTPRELTEFYLARIERLNPRLRAFISVRSERALEEADAALKRLQEGERSHYVGQPAASIPAGFDGDGLPHAIQLAGPPNSETTIVSLAAQIEAATSWRRERPAAVTNCQ